MKKGVTLLELMIVVAILGITASLGMGLYVNIKNNNPEAPAAITEIQERNNQLEQLEKLE